MTATLTVPAARGAPPKDLETRPKQVKAWADALPLAQSADVARQVRDHLAGLNAAKIDADDRVQILQNYRPIVSVVLEELEAIYAKSAIPLPTRARDALFLARDLGSQLATAYTIAASDKSAKLIAFGAKKQVPQLLLRALEHLCAVLRASYKSYTPAPEGVWRAVHEIYLYSEAQGFVAEPADAETKASILDTYGEALLLALTDPYRLSPGELDRVLGQLRSVKAPVVLGQAKLTTRPYRALPRSLRHRQAAEARALGERRPWRKKLAALRREPGGREAARSQGRIRQGPGLRGAQAIHGHRRARAAPQSSSRCGAIPRSARAGAT
jgi:hypothetical protein